MEEIFGCGATFSLSGSRVATRLRDLPRQVNVITSEPVEDTNSTTVAEAGGYVSSTDFDLDSNLSGAAKTEDPLSKLRLRGFPISTAYRNFNPQYSPWGPMIDSIEVVKGPASTLYGRVAPGGLVNIITKRPELTNERGNDVSSLKWGEPLQSPHRRGTNRISASPAGAHHGRIQWHDRVFPIR